MWLTEQRFFWSDHYDHYFLNDLSICSELCASLFILTLPTIV
jgi:hypothetical protein